jgi:hypothetical protein
MAGRFALGAVRDRVPSGVASRPECLWIQGILPLSARMADSELKRNGSSSNAAA